ncbi:Sm-like protein [Drosera capensis]
MGLCGLSLPLCNSNRPNCPEMSGGGGAGGAGAGGGGGEKAFASAKAPSEFLKSIRGRPVVVKLNSGVDYRGILACLDGYMNIAMEQTEEYVNGQLKNKYGDAFIRGNNVLYISTTKRTAADGS